MLSRNCKVSLKLSQIATFVTYRLKLSAEAFARIYTMFMYPPQLKEVNMNIVTRFFVAVILSVVLVTTANASSQRIISLSASSTEILFAIGAGDQVVAVDQWSNYPAEAPITDLSGYQPNIEAIAEFNPDLVVISYDPGELSAGLGVLDIEVLMHTGPVNFDQMYDQISELGELSGHATEASALIAAMKSDIAAAIASVPAGKSGSHVYHELDETFYSVSSASFLGQVYAAFGLVNIADKADPDGYGYPQLSPEYILSANPELIIIRTGAGYGAEELAQRPGWDLIDAIKNDEVILVDADIASRWGPRIVEYVQLIAASLQR
jgi:iron complex transport system substrate-binding protein